MLEWLVVLVRLEMLSEEFWRLISSSENQDRREQIEYREGSL